MKLVRWGGSPSVSEQHLSLLWLSGYWADETRRQPLKRKSEAIRRAVAKDAHDLARVHIGTWQEAYKNDFPAEFLESFDVEARARWFTNQIEGGAVIMVAEEGPETVGFCWVGPSDDAAWAEIYAIYVDPNRWTTGVGYRLFATSVDGLVSLGYEKVMLWVLESNGRARRFYERQGMTVGRPIRIEEIGGVQVTEIRYELDLPVFSSPTQGHSGKSP